MLPEDNTHLHMGGPNRFHFHLDSDQQETPNSTSASRFPLAQAPSKSGEVDARPSTGAKSGLELYSYSWLIARRSGLCRLI